VEFSIVPLSSNDVPRTLKVFPQKQQIQELGKEPEKESPEKSQISWASSSRLLIVGTSMPQSSASSRADWRQFAGAGG